MSGTKNKYIIGLTGNIGTGKSVVRRMLGHLGAYGIDADALGHRAIAKGAPGYQPVVDLFGTWILNSEGQIDRKRLAKIVFDNPAALQSLENVIHPLVSRAVDLLIRRTPHQIVVIEAIKLVESNLTSKCNAIWVTYTPDKDQVERLVEKRGMSQVEALSRIRMQSSQKDKISKADLVIINDSSFEKIWKQVYEAWNKIPTNVTETFEEVVTVPVVTVGVESVFEIRRGSPKDAAEIAVLMNLLHPNGANINRHDVIESFGEKAYMLLYNQQNGDMLGLLTWQVENLITRVFDILLLPEVFAVEAVMRCCKWWKKNQNCCRWKPAWSLCPNSMEFQKIYCKNWVINAVNWQTWTTNSWQEAAREGLEAGQLFYMKVLRTQRVLRPI